MSSKAGKMEKAILKADMPEQKTKSVTFRIDVELAYEGTKTTYMIVTGVPEDLPQEAMDSVKYVAEQQFASAICSKRFLEFYDEGMSSKEQQPVFYNTDNLNWIKVVEITQLN